MNSRSNGRWVNVSSFAIRCADGSSSDVSSWLTRPLETPSSAARRDFVYSAMVSHEDSTSVLTTIVGTFMFSRGKSRFTADKQKAEKESDYTPLKKACQQLFSLKKFLGGSGDGEGGQRLKEIRE